MSASEFFSINRSALILKPKQALIDWVNQIFPEEPLEYDFEEQHDSQDIFLIPEVDSVEEGLEWLKENFDYFMQYELDSYCADTSRWPDELDWTLFERFFDYSLQIEVIDTVEDEEDFEDLDSAFN